MKQRIYTDISELHRTIQTIYPQRMMRIKHKIGYSITGNIQDVECGNARKMGFCEEENKNDILAKKWVDNERSVCYYKIPPPRERNSGSKSIKAKLFEQNILFEKVPKKIKKSC